MLNSRPWTRNERRVVFRGFFGRLSVAIEPLFIGTFFSLLPLGLFLADRREIALLLAPIFAVAAIAFLAWGIALLVPSARAVLETFAPISVVDGYVQYRRSLQGDAPVFHVGVLDLQGRLLGEWPLSAWPHAIGERDLWPASVEFTKLGGIHRIDGHTTGVLPEAMPPLGIGAARSAALHA